MMRHPSRPWMRGGTRVSEPPCTQPHDGRWRAPDSARAPPPAVHETCETRGVAPPQTQEALVTRSHHYACERARRDLMRRLPRAHRRTAHRHGGAVVARRRGRRRSVPRRDSARAHAAPAPQRGPRRTRRRGSAAPPVRALLRLRCASGGAEQLYRLPAEGAPALLPGERPWLHSRGRGVPEEGCACDVDVTGR
jgi:hypothetical protein